MGSDIERWTVSDLAIMAEQVAKSRLFGLDQAQAFTLMALAQSEGIHPMKAVQRYHVIQGKPSMKADAMLADFLRIGGTVEWITECDDRERCEAIFKHPTYAPKGKTIRFTMQDAKAAGLAGKEIWRQYPANLMRARVVSTGVRMIAPGIVAGLYTEEEVKDFVDEEKPVKEIKANITASLTRIKPLNVNESLDAYRAWLSQAVDAVNQRWLEKLTSEHGSIPKSAPSEIVTETVLADHMQLWSKSKEIMTTAITWSENPDQFEEEARGFCRILWRKAAARVKQPKKEPIVTKLLTEDEILDQLVETPDGIVDAITTNADNQ